MYKKILIPLENTPTDTTILEHIQPLAQLTQASFVLVHVADGYAARLQEQLNLNESEEMKEDKIYLEQTAQHLIKKGFKVKSYLVGGEPAQGIINIAHQEKCDLIAMSTHGHGFVKDVIYGSVANEVRHKTDIPVLMIRSSENTKK